MKRIFTIFLTLFVASSVWAIEIDGINYRYDSQTNTCSVISGNYSGDVVIPATVSGRYMNFAQHIVAMGGAKSANGYFYTFDKGVQNKKQVEEDATNVIFEFNWHNLSGDVSQFISGTESTNEIVKSQALETKFVMIGNATEEKFVNVDWSMSSTTIDISKKLEQGKNAVAFKNEQCEGFFELISYDEEIEDLTISIWVCNGVMPFEDASVTTIESGAFRNCTELNSITIPNSVTSIGYEAFSGCTKLTKVTCMATTPPEAYSNSFENYNGYLYIPCDNKEEYEIDACWGSFKHVECIGSETVELTKDEVAVVPEKNEAVFSMPKNEDANTYTLTISNNGVTFCTLTFNAQGQLANIDFSTTKSYELKSDVEGFKFTVTGLSTASDYGYSFKALASNKSVLKEYAGSFTTKNEDGTGGSVQGGGEGTLAVEAVSNATAVTIVNGQIFVNGEAPAFVVTVSGQKIANANLKSGVYFGIVDGETVKVVVR